MTLGMAFDEVFQRYFSALCEGDSHVMTLVIDSLLAKQMPLTRIYTEFVQKGMYEIGLLWERGEITVAHEHLAASATQVVISELYLKHLSPRATSREAVIACVPDEMHDVGTMVIAGVFEYAGWKTVLLGANTPTEELLRYLIRRQSLPNLLALSITLSIHRYRLEAALASITSQFPELLILVGGQGLEGSAEAEQYRRQLLARYPSVRYIDTLDTLTKYLNGMRQEPEK